MFLPLPLTWLLSSVRKWLSAITPVRVRRINKLSSVKHVSAAAIRHESRMALDRGGGIHFHRAGEGGRRFYTAETFAAQFVRATIGHGLVCYRDGLRNRWVDSTYGLALCQYLLVRFSAKTNRLAGVSSAGRC